MTTIWPGFTERMTSAPTALFAHPVDEGFHDVERDVGLEQRAAHLAQRLVDVGLRQRAAAGDLVENAAQAVGQRLEHQDLKT